MILKLIIVLIAIILYLIRWVYRLNMVVNQNYDDINELKEKINQ